MNEITASRTTDFTDGATALSAISPSERHRLLSAERRRVALRVFEEQSLPMGLAALAEAVEARESGAADADAIRITLHHQHLPLLTDFGVVDYDADTRRVRAP